MSSINGSTYKIVCDETNNPPDVVDSGNLIADIYYHPNPREATTIISHVDLNQIMSDGEKNDIEEMIRRVCSNYIGHVNDETTKQRIINDITYLLRTNPRMLKKFKSEFLNELPRRPIIDNRSELEKELAEMILG